MKTLEYGMRIGVVQTRPVKGDIPLNIKDHGRWTEVAISEGADAIFFPELSVTGYEPSLAGDLAISKDDSRLDHFRRMSDRWGITIGAGIPLRNKDGVSISMILFHPGHESTIYSKKYLHTDEEPFFISREDIPVFELKGAQIAPAICYELSIPEHSENAYRNGAGIYVASVAKTAGGVEKAMESLSGIAKKYGMIVLMSNCVGPSDNFISAGNSSVWNQRGELLGRLDDYSEGILIYDTETQELIKPAAG